MSVVNPDTTKYTGTFLDTEDLVHFSQTNKARKAILADDLVKRKRLCEELLQHVFNADPKQVAELFTKPYVNGKIVLKKLPFKEGYHSKRQKGFVCFRHYRSISAIQAAARCGDNFLLLVLLSHIVGDQKLRKEAALQLREVLYPKAQVKPKTQGAAGDSKKSAESAGDKKQAKEDSILSLFGPYFAYLNAKMGDGKSSVERKIQKEVTKKLEDAKKVDQEFADETEYLAPFKDLVKHSEDYVSQSAILATPELYTKLDRLWGILGEFHKRLSRYGFQELFDKKPISSKPEFNSPPSREECIYFDKKPLDLDEVGIDTLSAFFRVKVKGTWHMSRVAYGPESTVRTWRPAGLLLNDSESIKLFCEVRQAELENIIDCLLTPGAPITLDRKKKAMPAKP